MTYKCTTVPCGRALAQTYWSSIKYICICGWVIIVCGENTDLYPFRLYSIRAWVSLSHCSTLVEIISSHSLLPAFQRGLSSLRKYLSQLGPTALVFSAPSICVRCTTFQTLNVHVIHHHYSLLKMASATPAACMRHQGRSDCLRRHWTLGQITSTEKILHLGCSNWTLNQSWDTCGQRNSFTESFRLLNVTLALW